MWGDINKEDKKIKGDIPKEDKKIGGIHIKRIKTMNINIFWGGIKLFVHKGDKKMRGIKKWGGQK